MPAPVWPTKTERLLLRPFEEGDLDALHAIDSDESVVRWLYNDVRTPEETRELLAHKVAGATVRGEGEWLSAAAALRENGELVGDVSLLWASQAHHQGELGFVFHPAHHGKGYATEGLEADARLRLRGARPPPGRRAARAAKRRLGPCTREARDAPGGASRGEQWVKGEWQSELIYALLAREWRDGSPGTGRSDDRY